MKYGFVIDNRRCIGCHACTVACKAEHEVPLGNFRTWVKNVEKGTFPNVRRYFAVLRCNHCEDAPCVNICPTKALFHRSDGIVDFDRDHCIACRSCMAACPYDAIYIDPDTRTAAKCNYCAHKLELMLEPACVTVCPERAIIAGDLDSSQSEIAGLIARQQVTVRKPEKGTEPNVYYIDGDVATLNPLAAPKPITYMWAQRPIEEILDDPRLSEETDTVRTVYDVGHEKPWGGHISLYLWAKSMASGPILIVSILVLLGITGPPRLFDQFAPGMSLAMLFITTLLLVVDLGRPERFLKLLYHPNWHSWLVWGAFILLGFSAVTFFWLLGGVLGIGSLIDDLLWPGLILSSITASYSAFLIAQARARDLWQSPLLFPHLTVQAFVAGAALLVLGCLYFDIGRGMSNLMVRCLLGGLCLHGLLIISEVARPHGSNGVTEAIRVMIAGSLSRSFWLGAVFGGVAAPILLVVAYLQEPSLGFIFPAMASVISLLGLLAFEDCYIRAGQALPLS